MMAMGAVVSDSKTTAQERPSKITTRSLSRPACRKQRKLTMANKDYNAGSKPRRKGEGWYSSSDMGKDPVRKPAGEAGNSTTKGR
jgi:hypothetical protein